MTPTSDANRKSEQSRKGDNPSTLTLWHASRSDVERPTVSGRITGEHHANSGLGLFCATAPHSYIAGFGDHIHEITLKPGTRILHMDLGELQKMGEAPRVEPHRKWFESEGFTLTGERDRAWFEAEGFRLSEDHDIIMIRERNGYASQAVILHDDCVEMTKAHSKADFLASAVDIMDAMAAHEASKPEMVASRGIDRPEHDPSMMVRPQNER